LLQSGKLNPAKYEILINDNCNDRCQFYAEHFHQINHVNRAIKTPWETDWDKSFQIEIKPKTKAGIQKTGNCVTENMDEHYLQPYVDAGVTHFKISGRDLLDIEFEQSLPKHLGVIQKLLSKVPVE
jgi:collagenase-like PrtC family protease